MLSTAAVVVSPRAVAVLRVAALGVAETAMAALRRPTPLTDTTTRLPIAEIWSIPHAVVVAPQKTTLPHAPRATATRNLRVAAALIWAALAMAASPVKARHEVASPAAARAVASPVEGLHAVEASSGDVGRWAATAVSDFEHLLIHRHLLTSTSFTYHP